MNKPIEGGSFGVPNGVDHKPKAVSTKVHTRKHIRDFTDHIGPAHEGHPYNERHDGELGVK